MRDSQAWAEAIPQGPDALATACAGFFDAPSPPLLLPSHAFQNLRSWMSDLPGDGSGGF